MACNSRQPPPSAGAVRAGPQVRCVCGGDGAIAGQRNPHCVRVPPAGVLAAGPRGGIVAAPTPPRGRRAGGCVRALPAQVRAGRWPPLSSALSNK